MKNRLVKLFGYLGLTAILAIVAATCFLVFRNSFRSLSNTDDFISAFSGAFFAFIFVKLGELGTRLYLRERSNQTALVTLEQTLQDYINRLYDNDFVIDDIVKTIDNTTKKPSAAIKVNFNFLKPLPIDSSIMLNLRNLNYKNDLFNFYADLDKVNNSLATVQRYYDRITDSYIAGKMDKATYIKNLEVIKEKLGELKQFLAASIEDCIEVAAITRLLLRQVSIWFLSAIQLKPQNYTESLKSKLPAEKQVLQKEMEENTAESSKRIKDILAKS
jgi:hypothetical protein